MRPSQKIKTKKKPWASQHFRGRDRMIRGKCKVILGYIVRSSLGYHMNSYLSRTNTNDQALEICFLLNRILYLVLYLPKNISVQEKITRNQAIGSKH